MSSTHRAIRHITYHPWIAPCLAKQHMVVFPHFYSFTATWVIGCGCRLATLIVVIAVVSRSCLYGGGVGYSVALPLFSARRMLYDVHVERHHEVGSGKGQ